MPATANEALIDALIRHQTYLLRYSGTVRNQINGLLDGTEEDLAMRIRDMLRNSKGLTTPVEVRRLEALLKAIQAIRAGAWDKASAYLQEQMTQLAYQEPIILQTIIQEISPLVVETILPPTSLLKALVTTNPFEGRVLKDWASTMRADDMRRIGNTIRAGMIAGEPSNTIANRVFGTTLLKGSDGITELTRRQVASVTRTAVQHYANASRSEFTQENIDVILTEVYVATLDSRTTPICRALDGKRFLPGEGPQPPLHYNCRSLRVPTIRDDLGGTRPAVTAVEKRLVREFADENDLGALSDRDDLPRGWKGKYDEWAYKKTRALIGQVPADQSYQVWLSNQSKVFQDDTLGPTRAKLFRDGGLTLDKFVATNGTELTLEQLAQRHKDAFAAAGLDWKKF